MGSPNMDELRRGLESKEDEKKIGAMKSLISWIVQGKGDELSRLLMHVIKFCTQSANHTLKKLLLVYWEILDMHKPDGKLREEMILVCESWKKNLVHANEYVRGSTLRFLCKMKEPEILQSLIPAITANLEYRNAYVRKNAVLAVFSIHRQFPKLIPDAADRIEKFLDSEVNSAARRNAFLMLYHVYEQRAMAYLYTNLEQLQSFGESFQLVALELIRKVSRTKAFAEVKSQYVRTIYALTECPSNPVAYEAANTLVTLSAAPVAVRRAVAAYTRLLSSESDSSVKLIILGRLNKLRKRHKAVLSDMVMEVLRSLTTPNNEIRRAIIDLALKLLTNRNVDSVLTVFKKQLQLTDERGHGDKIGYRKILIEAMHSCATRYPQVVPSVVTILMNYLGDNNESGAKDVILFVRHIVEEYPKLRVSILTRLLESLDEIRSADVFRVAFWILGEYADEIKVLESALAAVRELVGPLPFVLPSAGGDESGDEAEEGGEDGKGAASGAESERKVYETKTKVLADGTYASQSAAESLGMTSAGTADDDDEENSARLRSMLLAGDSFLAACLCSSVTKMIVRFVRLGGGSKGKPGVNQEVARGLLLMSSCLRLGETPKCGVALDRDSRQRILTCIRALLRPEAVTDALLNQCRASFRGMLELDRARKSKDTTADDDDDLKDNAEVDDVIRIRQLRPEKELWDVNADGDDVKKAVGNGKGSLDLNSKLSRVYQLTGFADSVYAEAYLTVLDFDILLDVLVVNQTNESLQNLVVELNTSGDLKIVDNPQQYTIGPRQSKTINVSVKVASTESSVIFGNIVYSTARGTDKKIVVLNSIHMDIMDYINPATCSDVEFRNMWAEFEWENKVSVITDFRDLTAYLAHIIKITNMKCLTPNVDQYGACGFLAANLYARSIFNEDALLNLSVEKRKDGKINGYVRIRSKTQGVALSLGDKIQVNQRMEQKRGAQAEVAAKTSESKN